MSTCPWRSVRGACRGFTLIEVMGALVIFSVGVLMVLQLTGTLSRQMERAGKTAALVARAQERVDSLESVPFDSLTVGSTTRSVSVMGTPYTLRDSVVAQTAVLKRIVVMLTPVTAGAGPAYATTSFSAAQW